MMIINLILIQIILVYIIDISGVVDVFKHFIFKKLYGTKIAYKEIKMKPFDCSLCSTFWISLLYLIISYKLSIMMIAFVCLLSFLTTTTKNIYILIYDFLNYIIIKINKKINK